MEDPLFTPDKMIVDENDRPLVNAKNLRPNSVRPYEVDQTRATIKFWFMPAVPIESIRLPTAENVVSFSVSYVRPNKAIVPVAEVSFTMLFRVTNYELCTRNVPSTLSLIRSN